MPETQYVVTSSWTITFISADFGKTWQVLGNPTSGFWSIKSSGQRVVMTDGRQVWTLNLDGI